MNTPEPSPRYGELDLLRGDLSIEPETRAGEDRFFVATRLDEDRISLYWRFKLVIVGITLAVAAATFFVSSAIPATYSSTGEVTVSAQNAANAQDAVTASNDLAAQYAPVARGGSVVQAAAADAGVSAATIAKGVSSSVLQNQNLVQVSVQASSPELARRCTQAVVDALVKYVDDQGDAITKQYTDQTKAQLKPIDDAIKQAKSDLKDATAAAASASDATRPLRTSELNAAQQSLANLQTQRQTTVAQTSKAPPTPKPSVLTRAQAGTQVAPRPVLYTAVAAALALVLSAEIAVALARRPVARARRIRRREQRQDLQERRRRRRAQS